MKIPTTKEELERKVVEYLEQQVHASEAGNLDKFDLALIGRSLWTVTSGLVDGDVTGFCSSVADLGQCRVKERYLVGNGKVMHVYWVNEKDVFYVKSTNATTLMTTNKTVPCEAGERDNKLSALFASLQGAGYVELP